MHKFHLAALLPLAICFTASGCQAEEVDENDKDIRVNTIVLNEGEKAFSVGDFNDDGYSDLIVAEAATNGIVVLLNDGTGQLNRANHYPAGNNPTWLAVLDFDRDGANDLAIVNHEATSATLLRGDNDGAFDLAEQSPLALVIEPHSHMVDVADLNGDGFSDLIFDSRDRSGIFILSGREGGQFSASGQSVDVGGSPYLGFAIGDVNGDGAPDIVTPNADHISVMLNRGGGELSFDKVTSIPLRSPFAVAAGDMTGDGHIDLVVASEDAEQGIIILSGDGEGNFSKLKSFSIAAGAKMVAIGDMNGDGLSDAAVVSWNSDAVLVAGGTADLIAVELPINELRNPWSVIFADFDRDGLDEIVIGDATGTSVNIYSFGFSEGRN